jgi:riboflavin synthase
MFTGIVGGLVTVSTVSTLGNGVQLRIQFPNANSHLTEGASIALNGVCTTAIDIDSTGFTIQLLQETLKKTSFKTVSVGDSLNWELSVTPTTALGGHFVYGHVDEVGTLLSAHSSGPWTVIQIGYSDQYRPYLIPKGSICIDGISLTVVDVTPTFFSCHIIPHTLDKTVLGSKKSGDSVNLEYDIIAKYLYNFHLGTQGPPPILDTLKKAGYL